MASQKISPALRSRLADTTATELEVIVELVPQPQPAEPELGRDELVARRRAAFAARADVVATVVRGLGGDVLGRSWLAESLHAAVPVAAVPGIAQLATVALVDVPAAISPDVT